MSFYNKSILSIIILDGIPSNTLKEVEIEVVLPRDCRLFYGEETITNHMICAGEKGRTTCAVSAQKYPSLVGYI